MSKYSGKCDFADVIEIWGEDVVLNCEIYVGETQIYPKRIEDLYPFYGTLISSMGMSKEKGDDGKYGRINLCKKPYYIERKEEIKEIYKGDERMIKERCEQLDEFYGEQLKNLCTRGALEKLNEYVEFHTDEPCVWEVHYCKFPNPMDEFFDVFETYKNAVEYANNLKDSFNIYIVKK